MSKKRMSRSRMAMLAAGVMLSIWLSLGVKAYQGEKVIRAGETGTFGADYITDRMTTENDRPFRWWRVTSGDGYNLWFDADRNNPQGWSVDVDEESQYGFPKSV